MSRNGSGTYSRVAGTPYVYNTIIDEVVVNAEFNDIAAALTASLAKDGQTTPTANLPMGGFRHTNVDAAAARTDYARASQVQDGTLTYLTSVAGTGNAITASAPIGLVAYAAGQMFHFIAANDNTAATTLNINGIGAKNIVIDAQALTGGEITSGSAVVVVYDGTSFQLAAVSGSAFGTRGRIYGPFEIRGADGSVTMTFNNTNNVGTAPDVQFESSGMIAAKDHVYINIDSDSSGTDAKFVISKNAPTTAGEELLVVRETGDVLIGTSTLGTGLTRILASNSLCLELTNDDTNAMDKAGGACVSRYTNSHAPMQVIRGSSTATENIVDIGGGSASAAPATKIRFRTNTLSSTGGAGNFVGSFSDTGEFVVDGLPANTTASAANVFANGSGELLTSTSSIEFKDHIEDMDLGIAKLLVEKFRAVYYRSKCVKDRNDWSWYGAIAEEVYAIDPRFVHMGYFPDDYELAEVSDGFEQVPVMEDVEVESDHIEIVDGVAVLTKVKEQRQVQAVDHFPVYQEGAQVFAERKDKDGEVLERKAVMYARPRFERVEVKTMKRQLKADAVLKPVGLMYDRFTVPLMMVAQDHERRQLALEAGLAELRALVLPLEGR